MYSIGQNLTAVVRRVRAGPFDRFTCRRDYSGVRALPVDARGGQSLGDVPMDALYRRTRPSCRTWRSTRPTAAARERGSRSTIINLSGRRFPSVQAAL